MIGSQAEIAEPRATVPAATARARVPARWSATPTTVRPTVGRRPDRADRRLGGRQPEPIDELRLLVGAQEEVDRRVAAAQPGPVRLAHGAAGQHDAQPRVGRLEPRELALPADHLLLGALADRAGVDHDEVGRLERRRLLAAGGQQAAGHLLGVAPVHLAAERPDVEARQRARLRAGTRRGARRPGRRAARVARARTLGPTRSRTGRARSGGGCVGHGAVMVRGTPALSGYALRMELLTNPETWVALADPDGAGDRARHRQRHLHLDPRPAAAGRRRATGRASSAWALAMGMRILLLLTISWIVGLTEPLFEVVGRPISVRDLILIGGGLFLLWKATTEIHESLEGEEAHAPSATADGDRSAACSSRSCCSTSSSRSTRS